MDESGFKLLYIAKGNKKISMASVKRANANALSTERCSILCLYPVTTAGCLCALGADWLATVTLDLLTPAAFASTPDSSTLKR